MKTNLTDIVIAARNAEANISERIAIHADVETREEFALALAKGIRLIASCNPTHKGTGFEIPTHRVPGYIVPANIYADEVKVTFRMLKDALRYIANGKVDDYMDIELAPRNPEWANG